jgi:hypothetical protein
VDKIAAGSMEPRQFVLMLTEMKKAPFSSGLGPLQSGRLNPKWSDRRAHRPKMQASRKSLQHDIRFTALEKFERLQDEMSAISPLPRTSCVIRAVRKRAMVNPASG